MNVSGTEFTTNLPRPYGFLIFPRAALARAGNSDKELITLTLIPRRIPFVAAPGRLGLFDPRPELFKPTPQDH
jgi:hypothetical protein